MKQIQVSLCILIVLLSSCKTDSNQIPEGFQIEAGFTLELVVSEPLIADPVDIQFDEHGNVFVLQMPGYPFEDKQSSVILLKDENQDGVFDQGIEYADRLQLASSILPYQNGLLVAAPPYLLHIKDTDGNDVVDQRDTLMSGFSTGNLQHNYNGLSFGIDNWIYAANGGNSGKPFWWGDEQDVVDLQGDDLRFRLDTKEMERVGYSSGGFGLAFDEYGRMFQTHNLEHVSQLVFPSRYSVGTVLPDAHALANISNHEENGLARIYPIGEQESRVNHPEQSGYFSGSCGITYYGGASLGSNYDQTIWVADVVLNLLHVDRISEKGSAMEADRLLEKHDFLASTDRAFRPVNMTVGPDGAMYVVDMYRKVIEHPEWIPDDIERTLDLEAGKDQGRIYKITKVDKSPDQIDFDLFNNQAGKIAALNSKNQWVRTTAQRLLVDVDLAEESIFELQSTVEQGGSYAKTHALWVLHHHDVLDPKLLLQSLQSSDAGLLENALQIAESYLVNEDIRAVCISLLESNAQRVRMQAGLTLSTLPVKIFNIHSREILEAINRSSELEMDQWNVAALTLAAKDQKTSLFKNMMTSKGSNELLSALALASANDETKLYEMLTAIADSDIEDSSKMEIIDAMIESADSKSKSTTIRTVLEDVEKEATLPLMTSIWKLRGKLNLTPSAKFLEYSKTAVAQVQNKTLTEEERLQQLEILALLPHKLKSKTLYKLLSNKEPISIQDGALQQLWQTKEKGIGQKLVSLWSGLGPHARRVASDILLYNEENHDALLTGLESNAINIGEMNFDLERRRTLLWWTDNERTKRRAEALFSDAGVVNRKEVIHQMKDALSLQGSSNNGAEVFDVLCGQCHLYGAKGVDVGPALTEINRKSKASLLHDILDPNAAVDTKYINHKLETNAGDIHIGIVASETDERITIKKMGGISETIHKRDIKELSSLGTSLMMEGLEGNMDHQNMADLLAFLQEG